MNNFERLENTLAGEQVDHIPTALWRHWAGDDQRVADFVRATVGFQVDYDWDFLRIMSPSNYSVLDFGVQDNWQGENHGQRTIIKSLIKRSLDWTEIRPIEPSRGSLGRQYEAIRLISDELAETTPILPSIYSPLAQALRLSSQDTILRNMRTHPDRLRTGLNVLTESTLRFIEQIRRLPIVGIFFITEMANYTIMSEAEYASFGMPYNHKILETIPNSWWFNIVQINGSAPMLRLFHDTPAQAINWQDREARPDLERGRSVWNGTISGGLGEITHLHLGTPAIIREMVRDAIRQTDGKRLIVSTGSQIPMTTPLSNLRALRSAVESTVS